MAGTGWSAVQRETQRDLGRPGAKRASRRSRQQSATWVAAWVAALALISLAAPAQAWQPMTSKRGARLAWRRPPTLGRVHAPAAWQPKVRAALSAAASAWTAPGCTGLRVGQGGVVPELEPLVGPSISVAFVLPSRPRPGRPAWTNVTASRWGGIRSATIFLNADVFVGNDAPPDLRSVLLHELGHALGLDHTHASGAVMAPHILEGDRRDTLRPDDRAAVCALYPRGAFDRPRSANAGWAWAWWLLLLLPAAPVTAMHLRRGDPDRRPRVR